MKKKLLLVLMVLCLILAMAPAVMAEGDGDTVYTEWTSTTSLPTASGAYKLMNDVSMNSSVSYSGRSIVLDLNGHSITFTNATKNSAAFYFYGNSSLTLEDSVGGGKISNDDSCGNYLVYINGGNFTMTGGIIENAKSGGTALYINSDCQATISGGEVLNSASRGEALFINSSATVEMNQGTIKNTVDGGNAVYVNGSASFAMSGGSVIQESTYDSAAAIDANNSVVTINISGGSIISNSKGIKAYFTPVTVTGGNFDTDGYTFFTRNLSVEPDSDSDVSVTSDTGVIYSLADSANKISAGTFTAPYIVAPYTNSDISTLEISGGTFNGLTKVEAQDTNTDITITSGTFTNSEDKGCEDVNNYIPDDIAMKVDPDTGEIVVDNETSIATVDGIGYDTFAAALNALKDNSTLTLLQSVEVTSQIAIDEDNVTFDGGGFTISAGETFTGPDLMLVTGDSVTVKNVTLDGSSKAGYGVQFYEAGNATIQDVTAQNNTKNGIQVNASTVTASGKIELCNNGWGGGINVGYGQNIQSAPGCSFDITDATLVGVTAIYADAGDVERAEAASVDINVTVDGTDFVAVGDSGGISFVPESTIAGSAAIAVVAPDGTVTYYNNATSLQSAIDNAESGSTITLAPGTYEGNITFGGKSLTITAQHPAYSNGNYAADEDLSKFTGTFNTYGEDSGSFYPDQTIVIDGLALSGDGLKIGNNNYNSVGNLEVRHCTMELGSNLSNSSESNYAGLNYFVKVNGEPSDGNYASVIVEDNSIHGTAHDSISPVQLWDVDNAVVKNNVISMTGASSGYQAISISKMASDSTVEVTGNDITGIDGGIYITTWLLGGNTTDQAESFTGEITVSDNEISGAGATMHPIFIGYESATGVPYGILGTDCDIVASGNTSDGTPVSPVIGVPENATAEPTIVEVTLVNGDSVVSVTSGTSPLTVNLPTLTNTGYTFVGWRSNIDSRIYNNTYSATADVTLTAVWRVVESDTPDVKPVGPTYDIDVVDAENGSVSANLSNASEGSTIRLTVEPDEGYELGSLTVTGPDGRVEVTRVNASTYRFTMPDGDVTVRATFVSEGLPFTDVSTSAWYYDAVSYVYANGLMDGVSSTQFNPDGTMTRAMVWAILARIDGQTVTGDGWIETAREWAVAEGVSDGENANGAVTREQLVTMLWRYAGEPEGTAPLSAWSDAASVSDWAAEAMSWAIDNSVITGMSADTLAPQGSATRAQCAAILMRCADLLA